MMVAPHITQVILMTVKIEGRLTVFRNGCPVLTVLRVTFIAIIEVAKQKENSNKPMKTKLVEAKKHNG